MTWSSFVDAGAPSHHALQVYEDLEDFSTSVTAFVEAGLRVGEPAIVIATGDQWSRFAQELEQRGWDVSRLVDDGVVTYRDAAQTLAELLEGDMPSAERFEHVVVLVDEVAAAFPGRTIRVIGEMVDVLWQEGRGRGAAALEELWNELAKTRRFSLLCGYRLDIFDRDVQANALPDVFDAHTHVRPAAEGATLSAALDEALDALVDPLDIARIYLDVAEQVPRGKLPHAQAILGWLSTCEWPDAPKILERTRDNYARLRDSSR